VRKKIVLVPLAFLLAISLVAIACAPTPAPPTPAPPTPAPPTPTPPTPAPEKEVYTLRVQEAYPAGVVGYRIFERWAADMKTISEGQIDIKCYPEGGVVATFDAFDAVSTGVLDGFISWPQYWPGKHALAVYASSYPYGLDMQYMWEVWFYEAGGIELLQEDYARFNIHYVAPIHTGPNYAHCTKPLSKATDWNGLKCRYPGGMIAEIYAKLGASVIILPGGEIYTALATGVIDLGEYIGHAMNMQLGLHEVGKYIIGPGQMHQPVDTQAFVLTKDVWDEIPSHLQRLLEIGSRDLAASLNANIRGYDTVALEWMTEEYGNVYIEISAEERAKMRLASVELWRKWTKEEPGALKAVETQILLMREFGLLEFPGVPEEIEKYFPGLLAEPIAGHVKER
jgi:TRAP-type mannitol/chloroaromatic compound transport system substrate-binding protein